MGTVDEISVDWLKAFGNGKNAIASHADFEVQHAECIPIIYNGNEMAVGRQQRYHTLDGLEEPLRFRKCATHLLRKNHIHALENTSASTRGTFEKECGFLI